MDYGSRSACIRGSKDTEASRTCIKKDFIFIHLDATQQEGLHLRHGPARFLRIKKDFIFIHLCATQGCTCAASRLGWTTGAGALASGAARTPRSFSAHAEDGVPNKPLAGAEGLREPDLPHQR